MGFCNEWDASFCHSAPDQIIDVRPHCEAALCLRCACITGREIRAGQLYDATGALLNMAQVRACNATAVDKRAPLGLINSQIGATALFE